MALFSNFLPIFSLVVVLLQVSLLLFNCCRKKIRLLQSSKYRNNFNKIFWSKKFSTENRKLFFIHFSHLSKDLRHKVRHRCEGDAKQAKILGSFVPQIFFSKIECLFFRFFITKCFFFFICHKVSDFFCSLFLLFFRWKKYFQFQKFWGGKAQNQWFFSGEWEGG